MTVIFFKVYLGDSNRQPQPSREILNGTPRPNVPSQKAWLEIASGEREREREIKSDSWKAYFKARN